MRYYFLLLTIAIGIGTGSGLSPVGVPPHSMCGKYTDPDIHIKEAKPIPKYKQKIGGKAIITNLGNWTLNECGVTGAARLIGAMKTGTSWMGRMFHSLTKRSCADTDGCFCDMETPYEAHLVLRTSPPLVEFPCAWHLLTHDRKHAFQPEALNILNNGNYRTIHVTRDPRAASVSLVHYFTRGKGGIPTQYLDKCVLQCFERDLRTIVEMYWDCLKVKEMGYCRVFSYERMLLDTKTEAARFLDFVKLPLLGDDIIEEIRQHLSLEEMKALEEKHLLGQITPKKVPGKKIREGTTTGFMKYISKNVFDEITKLMVEIAPLELLKIWNVTDKLIYPENLRKIVIPGNGTSLGECKCAQTALRSEPNGYFPNYRDCETK